MSLKEAPVAQHYFKITAHNGYLFVESTTYQECAAQLLRHDSLLLAAKEYHLALL
jgi:hypothetical protein